MHRTHRALFAGALATLLLLSGCLGSLDGATTSSTGSGSTLSTPVGTGGGGGGGGGPTGLPGGGTGKVGTDSVVATPSVGGTFSVIVGSPQTLSITFTSSDGAAISGLAINGSLGTLPAGWTGPATFACATVSTGSGCMLNLTYAPTNVAMGTFTLNYIYIDKSGQGQTVGGSITVAYKATTNNNIVAKASPSGQITAVVGMGSQTVVVDFTTDDGNPATALMLNTDLTMLPAGWSSTGASFSCANVSTGNGCQLTLTYLPTAWAVGTLTLSFSYLNNSSIAKTGTVNIPYAATTNNNVVGTATPSGQITALAGAGTQPVSIAFTTDDGNPATAFTVTTNLSALPAGWNSSTNTLSCASVSTGNACTLSLTYAPPGIGSGTLTIGYSYNDNAGFAKTGALNIAYAATTNDNVVGTPSQSPLAVHTASSTNVQVTFTTDDGNLASALSVTSGLGSLPAGWSSSSGSFSCASVSTGSGCTLSLTYAPTTPSSGNVTLGYSYTSNSGTAKTGSATISYTATIPVLYVVEANANLVSYCPINNDGTLAACSTTGTGLSGPAEIALSGAYAYIANSSGNSVSECTLKANGSMSNCATTGGAFSGPLFVALNPASTEAYVYESSTGLSDVCAVSAANGSLASCAGTGPALGMFLGFAFSPSGAYAYGAYASPTTNGIAVCNVAANGTLSACTDTGTNTSNALATVAYYGGNLYTLTSDSPTAIDVCPVNANGTLGSCQVTASSSGASGLTFNGSWAYVSTGAGTVLQCPVQSDGTFGVCATLTDPTFDGTTGLAVK